MNRPEAANGAASGDPASRPVREPAVLVTVALCTMLAPLNSTMIAVALPHIMEGFGVELTGAGWLVTAYLIAMASLQPVAGKLGDRFGRRRFIFGGLVYFGIVSLAAEPPGFLSRSKACAIRVPRYETGWKPEKVSTPFFNVALCTATCLR